MSKPFSVSVCFTQHGWPELQLSKIHTHTKKRKNKDSSRHRRREEQLKGKVNSREVKCWEFMTLLVRFRTTNLFLFFFCWEVWAVRLHRRAFLELKRKKACRALWNQGNLTALPTEAPWHAPVQDVNIVCVHVHERETEGETEREWVECAVQLCGWQRRGITESDRSYLTNPKQQL